MGFILDVWAKARIKAKSLGGALMPRLMKIMSNGL